MRTISFNIYFYIIYFINAYILYKYYFYFKNSYNFSTYILLNIVI